jgi:hypothetical protein
MKRSLLLLLVIVLMVFELFLLEGFIPYEWRHPMSEQLGRIFPAPRYDPHPNMDWEIETVLRQHRSYRIALYLITAVLASGNACLIVMIWNIRGRLESPSNQA